MDPETIVANGYNEIATQYDNWDNHQIENTNRLTYIKKLSDLLLLQEELPKEQTLLDIGCASGRWTKELYHLTQCQNIIALDISQSQIEMAKKRFPNAKEYICQSIKSVDTFKKDQFNGIMALFSIFHLSPKDQIEIFPKIYHWLKPNGYFLLSLNPEVDDEEGDVSRPWMGTTMYWRSLGTAEYLSILKNSGFDIIENSLATEKTKNHGIDVLWIICQKKVNQDIL
ncbi:unnamed protein product [Cunninghamella blakesleeana]